MRKHSNPPMKAIANEICYRGGCLSPYSAANLIRVFGHPLSVRFGVAKH